VIVFAQDFSLKVVQAIDILIFVVASIDVNSMGVETVVRTQKDANFNAAMTTVND
jgi:hypothetical protein